MYAQLAASDLCRLITDYSRQLRADNPDYAYHETKYIQESYYYIFGEPWLRLVAIYRHIPWRVSSPTPRVTKTAW